MFSQTRTFDPSTFADLLNTQEMRLRASRKRRREPEPPRRPPKPAQSTLSGHRHNPAATRQGRGNHFLCEIRLASDSSGDDNSDVEPSPITPCPPTSREQRVRSRSKRRRRPLSRGSHDRQRTPGASEGGPGTDDSHKNSECDLCSRVLDGLAYPCRDCSVLVCPSCLLNAAILHPGHTIDEVTTSIRDERERPPLLIANPPQKNRPRDPTPNEPSETAESGQGHDDQATPSQHRCYVCNLALLEERYECQVCQDNLNLCKDCLDMHPDEHLLEVITCEPLKSTVKRPPVRHTTYNCFTCEQQLTSVRFECQTCSDHFNFCEDHRATHPKEHQLDAMEYVDTLPDTHGAWIYSRSNTEDSSTVEDGAAGGMEPVPGAGVLDAHDDAPTTQLEQRQSRYSGDVDAATRTASALRSMAHPDSRPSWGRSSLLKLAQDLEQLAGLARSLAVNQLVDGDEEDDDSYDPDRLVDFDQDFLVHDDFPEPRRRSSHRVDSPLKQRWLPAHKQRLSELKAAGKSDTYIATQLGRSPGAIAQQWRKQRDY